MALRIVYESEPLQIESLTICIYGPPGLGKTSLGFTADSPFLIDFDRGAHRSANRRDCSQCDTWEDTADITDKMLAPFKTVIVDTAGRALDLLTKTIIDDGEGKMGKNGQLSMPGFGRLKSTFGAWNASLKLMRKDVIMIAHSSEEKKGDDTIERLDVQGGSKNEIYKSADVMGRIFLKGGKRFLTCNPSEHGFGKNPANLPVLEIPDFATDPNWFGKIIRDVKASINSQSAGQKQAADYIAVWREKVTASLTCADYDALRIAINEETCNDSVKYIIKKMMQEQAAERGLKFDVDTKSFVKAA